jgi:hypothetical protein
MRKKGDAEKSNATAGSEPSAANRRDRASRGGNRPWASPRAAAVEAARITAAVVHAGLVKGAAVAVACLLAAFVLVAGSCKEKSPGGRCCFFVWEVKDNAACQQDILFVVDTSASMADMRSRLVVQLVGISNELALWRGPPSLHVGVVSADLGVGSEGVSGCTPEGNQARFLHGTCDATAFDGDYIIDVKPRGCAIKPRVEDACGTHDCTQENCSHEPGTEFFVDPDTGCPRCRNYRKEDLQEIVECALDVGRSGCMFSQPLEAMRMALESGSSSGFLREGAFLHVVIITNQDDCSAADSSLFEPDDENSDLGPLTPFRCFEHGVACDVGGRSPGPRHDCRPNEQPDGLIYPVSRYTSFLESIKDPMLVTTSAIAGPVGSEIVVTTDEQGRPMLEPSCATGSATAAPAVRLRSFVEQIEESVNLAFTSACSRQYDTALVVALCNNRLSVIMDPCSSYPLAGCSLQDGHVPDGGQESDETCVPSCKLSRLVSWDAQDGTPIPHCLEVCPEGVCPGNRDPSLSYAGGKPSAVDFDLPVDECWYASHEFCADPKYPEIRLPRSRDPPWKSWVQACCRLDPEWFERECDCSDHRDDDGDCLIDRQDPDC